MFLTTGLLKLIQPISQLAEQLRWVADVPPVPVRIIGLAEVAGALGVILPALARVRPDLTPLAAGGLVPVMVLAIPFHLLRGEAMMLPMNLVLAVLAGIVAWGRRQKARVQPRR